VIVHVKLFTLLLHGHFFFVKYKIIFICGEKKMSYFRMWRVYEVFSSIILENVLLLTHTLCDKVLLFCFLVKKFQIYIIGFLTKKCYRVIN